MSLVLYFFLLPFPKNKALSTNFSDKTSFLFKLPPDKAGFKRDRPGK